MNWVGVEFGVAAIGDAVAVVDDPIFFGYIGLALYRYLTTPFPCLPHALSQALSLEEHALEYKTFIRPVYV